jgi:hypothetical protein
MNMIRYLLNAGNFKFYPYIDVDEFALSQQIWNRLAITKQKFYSCGKLSCCYRRRLFFKEILYTSSKFLQKKIAVDLVKTSRNGLCVLTT